MARRFAWHCFLVAGACVGCQGVIGEAPGAGPPGQGSRPGGSAGSGGRPGGTVPDPTGGASAGGSQEAPTAGESPLRRLGKKELRNTLRDLFPALPASFDDAAKYPGGYSSIELPSDNEILLAFSLPGTVSDLEVKRFQELAEATLQALGNDAPNRQVDCAGKDETACARAFVTSFGKRAYRRPLDAVEVGDSMALFSKLRSDTGLGYDLPEALGVVVEAMLQAPGFLYRWERGLAAPRMDGKLVRFDAYEVASRLSYFIWNSMPDDALMAAADEDALGTPDAIAKQAARLLQDPRADETLSDFVSQWLELGPLPQLIKDADVYPTFRPALLGSLAEETAAFAVDVLRGSDPTFERLLTAPYTFADDSLARYYGLPRASDGRLDLSETPRLGVLTQGALMAVKGNSYRTSPVRRGKFVLNRMLCVMVPPPPPNVVPELPPPDPSLTLRQQMAAHRDNPSCSGCHDRMDPLGFAFEHFDGAGNWRADDRGHVIDSSGSIELDGAEVPFRDAAELARSLAASPEAHECFARQWLRYALDRFEQSTDEAAVVALAASFEESGLDTRQLIVDITRTLPFSHRAPAAGEVLPP